jgi:hypothetical protein
MNLIWNIIAKLCAHPRITDWLITRAMRTPYTPIYTPDGRLYMSRYWLFNPYPANTSGQSARWRFPISIRIHHILLPNADRAHHDHPWNARTIILRNYYVESRPRPFNPYITSSADHDQLHWRNTGDTATLNFGEYHYISHVPLEGVWTLFITGKYRGTWGFLVNGKKVHWREYLNVKSEG